MTTVPSACDCHPSHCPPDCTCPAGLLPTHPRPEAQLSRHRAHAQKCQGQNHHVHRNQHDGPRVWLWAVWAVGRAHWSVPHRLGVPPPALSRACRQHACRELLPARPAHKLNTQLPLYSCLVVAAAILCTPLHTHLIQSLLFLPATLCYTCKVTEAVRLRQYCKYSLRVWFKAAMRGREGICSERHKQGLHRNSSQAAPRFAGTCFARLRRLLA